MALYNMRKSQKYKIYKLKLIMEIYIYQSPNLADEEAIFFTSTIIFFIFVKSAFLSDNKKFSSDFMYKIIREITRRYIAYFLKPEDDY